MCISGPYLQKEATFLGVVYVIGLVSTNIFNVSHRLNWLTIVDKALHQLRRAVVHAVQCNGTTYLLLRKCVVLPK